MIKKIEGIVAAVFTPMHEDGSLNLDQVAPMVEYLIDSGINAFYVCGSTGEGPLLSSEERMATAKAYIQAANRRVPVIVQVGHDSLTEACRLAGHAASAGASHIAAVPSVYFKVDSVKTLIDCLAKICSASSGLPFYYYHIPRLTGVEVDMLDFLSEAAEQLPNFVGVKYSDFKVFELQRCLEFDNGRYDMLFGCDEMLLSGLTVGVKGAVGSTFNLSPGLYRNIIRCFEQGDIEEAGRLQSLSVSMVRILQTYRDQPAIKGAMKLLGLDCGPNRLPHRTLAAEELESLKKDLDRIGFFDWGPARKGNS